VSDANAFLLPDAPVLVARAPGRLDVMGGIADYSGATVLQLPLARVTTVLLQRQREPRCDLFTRRHGAWQSCSLPLGDLTSGPLRDPAALGRWFRDRADDRWAAYVAGVLQWCLQRAGDGQGSGGATDGFRIAIGSTVPEGMGIASSAALEVATMAAASRSCGLALTPEVMAAACQWVENHVVGAPCGIMDQMTSVAGRRDHLLRLRCQPGVIEGHVAVPAGYRFYGITSGARHAVTGADYVTVRAAAFMGYRIIADAAGFDAEPIADTVRVADPRWHGYLANIGAAEFATRFERLLPERMRGSEFIDRYQGTTDTVTRVRPDRTYPVRAATAHPVREQERIVRFAQLLDELRDRPEAATALGALMRASHDSYASCGLGSSATDRLVALAEAAGPAAGIFGAKITGGGSGGTVALLGTVEAEPHVRAIAARHAREAGCQAEVLLESGPGAAVLGTTVLEPAEAAKALQDAPVWSEGRRPAVPPSTR
jgi:L-arabinokinase